MVYDLSATIEFTLASSCHATDGGAAPDLIMRDVRDDMQGNGRAAVRSCGSSNAGYEVDWSFRAFLEVMFMAPPMVIYLRTDAGQSDGLAKVRTVQRVAGASGLQREKVITDAKVSGGIPLPMLLGYSEVEANRMRGGIHLYWNNVLLIPYFCNFAIKDGVIGIANVSPLPSYLPTQLMPHPDPPCVAQVDFLLANPEKEDFEKGGMHGLRWNSMENMLKQQVDVFEDSIFTQTSATTFELDTDFDGEVEGDDSGWVECERCASWRRLPLGIGLASIGATWQCGQPPMEQTRCYKSRKEDVSHKDDVTTKAHVHGVPVGSRESSVDSERKEMKQHVKAFVSSSTCPELINTAVKQQIREAVEKGMGKEQGALSAEKATIKMINAIISECSKEFLAEEERARLCLQRNDWFLQIMSSSGKLSDLAFPPTEAWSDYFQLYSQGQQLMPVVCRVLTVSVGIRGVLELQESKTSSCTLECYTLEQNRSVGFNMELPALAQDTWLRRGKVNVTELSLATVELLQSRLELHSPMTRDGGHMFRMGTDDLNSYTERMQCSEGLRLVQIQEKEARLEQLHYQKTPVEAAIERTFEKENRIPWAELAHDMQHPGGKGATGQVSKFTWSSQVENEGSKTVALKQFTNVTSLDKWTSEGSQALKREIYLARACSGLDHVIAFLGITFVEDIELPKSLGLVYEWKEQNLAQLLLTRGAVVGPDKERTMISILLQIAGALEALHQQTPAIVHRDLKPSNVLIEKVIAGDTEQFRAYLCDFGSAKAMSSLSDLTNTGNVGTKVFQAPELASEARITHKCDVYSFGVTAAQLALGVPAVELESRLKSPLTFQCTDSIRNLIGDCMEYSPQERPDFTAIKLKLSSMLQRDNKNRTADRADIGFIRHSSATGKAVVFRVLNDTQYARDILQEGLTAGSPFDQTTSAVEHVKDDRNVPKSRYISTTVSAEWALYYFAKMKLVKPYETCLIVCIDLDKLPITCKVHWLNRPDTRTRLGFGEGAGTVAKNFAQSAYEVLIEPAAMQPVPLAAITTVYRAQDMLLTENVCLFDKLKEGLLVGGKKDGKYMGYNDWSNKIAEFKRFGYRYTCTCTYTISCIHKHVQIHACIHTCTVSSLFCPQVQPDPREGSRKVEGSAALAGRKGVREGVQLPSRRQAGRHLDRQHCLSRGCAMAAGTPDRSHLSVPPPSGWLPATASKRGNGGQDDCPSQQQRQGLHA